MNQHDSSGSRGSNYRHELPQHGRGTQGDAPAKGARLLPPLLGGSESSSPRRGRTANSNRSTEADPLAGFGRFAANVRSRLAAGRLMYGDASFARDPAELVGELQQEALDLAGWGYILFCRLEAMREALAEPSDGIPARAEDGGQDA